MQSNVERYYSHLVKNIFRITNPIKKQIVKTECKVHKFINIEALEILKADGYVNEHAYMKKYIRELNAGVVWADQDYKSINHFYNPVRNKGLYGFSNAQMECFNYYTKALIKYFEGDEKTAMFYLGAACHLIQDVTIPQHVNIKLLKQHRKYEQWLIEVFEKHNEFKAKNGGIYLNSIKEYMLYNSRVALDAYNQFIHEENQEKKFYETTLIILLTAERTTSGLILNYLNDIEKMKAHAEKIVLRERHE